MKPITSSSIFSSNADNIYLFALYPPNIISIHLTVFEFWVFELLDIQRIHNVVRDDGLHDQHSWI